MGKDRHTTPGERLLALIRPGNRAETERATEAVEASAPSRATPEERSLFAPAAASQTAPATAIAPEAATASETATGSGTMAGSGMTGGAPEEKSLFATMEPLDGTETAPAASEPAPGASPLFPEAGPAASPAGKPAAPAASAARKRRRLSFGGKTHVGVDISGSQLVCLKIRGQDADYQILGTSRVPLPEGAEPGTPAFVDTLRRALADLCGSGPVPSVWAASQTARVNVQFVSIPKVGSRQVNNAVYWTAKKEMGFDEGTSIFDFERRGELAEQGTPRLGALAYTAERESARLIRESFAQAGFPLTGLTMEPFSHQNLFRRRLMPPNGGATAVLHVGQNWSRLEIGAGGNLIFVRVIKTSMAGMEQAVLDALEARGHRSAPAAVKAPAVAAPSAPPEPIGESVVDLDGLGFSDSSLVLELDAPLGPVTPPAPVPAPAPAPTAETRLEMGQARELLRCLVFGCEALDEVHPGWGVEEKDIIEMLDPAASRLVRQVEMTLKHFRESLGFEGVTRLAVSGFLGASKAFVAYMGEQLGLPCIPLNPMGDYQARDRDVPGIDAPGVLYTQALGLALSNNAVTPNILFTYREKAAAKTARALEQGTLVGLAVLLLGLAYFTLDARWTSRRLDVQYQTVARQLRSLGGKVDLDALTRRVAEVRRRRDALRTSLNRDRTLGVWGEALALVPDGVELGTLRADYGAPASARKSEPKARKGKAASQSAGRLVLEGMISGDGRLFDSKLASYVVALEHSPLFSSVTVSKNELEALEGGASGLHFVIALSLVEKAS